MRCPLCGGPVHEEAASFVREIGHEGDGADLEHSVNRRLAEALWMAIEALDTEAETLRALHRSVGAATLADDAAQQAQLLRSFSRRHASRWPAETDPA